MPSPFPGMDPYLENPSIWPDFHQALSTEIRNSLNGQLPAPYYARVAARPFSSLSAVGSSQVQATSDASPCLNSSPADRMGIQAAKHLKVRFVLARPLPAAQFPV
jgi:hypothetical protein